MQPILAGLPADAGTGAVASAINGYGANASDNVWNALGGVTFKSSQTPLIFDPVSTAAFGYASCTGPGPASTPRRASGGSSRPGEL